MNAIIAGVMGSGRGKSKRAKVAVARPRIEIKKKIFDLDEWLLVEGIVDDAAKEAFTMGHCGSLAIAIHEQTGWPIACVSTDKYADLRFNVDHICCIRPDGKYVDITGAVSRRTMQDRWSKYFGTKTSVAIVDKSTKKIDEDFRGNLIYYDPNHPAVVSFATLVAGRETP